MHGAKSGCNGQAGQCLVSALLIDIGTETEA